MLPLAHLLHRLLVHVPLAHVASLRSSRADGGGQRALLADVERRLGRLGWGDAVAMQDPTDESTFSVTAKPRLRAPASSDGVVVVVGAEPVQGDVVAAPAVEAIDSGMSADVQAALAMALAADENPRHLRGFASTLEPAFTASASLLRAKAELIDRRRDKRPGPRPEALAEPLVALSSGLGSAVAATWRRLAAEVGMREPASPPASVESVDRVRAALARYVARSGMPQDIVNDQVRMAAAIMASEGAIEVGDAPAEVEVAGRLAALHLGSGVFVVDPFVIEALCPLTGREGYVSPSSLSLALATMKPKWSRIADKKEAARLCTSLSNAKASDLPALMARAELSRATKAIERQRWATWYRTIAETRPTLSAPGASGAPRIGSFKLSRVRRAS